MNGELHACDSPYSKRIIRNLLNNVSAHSVPSYLRAGNNKNEIFKDPVAMCPRNFPLAAVYQAVHLRRFSELPRLVGFSSWKRKPTHTRGGSFFCISSRLTETGQGLGQYFFVCRQDKKGRIPQDSAELTWTRYWAVSLLVTAAVAGTIPLCLESDASSKAAGWPPFAATVSRLEQVDQAKVDSLQTQCSTSRRGWSSAHFALRANWP